MSDKDSRGFEDALAEIRRAELLLGSHCFEALVPESVRAEAHQTGS